MNRKKIPDTLIPRTSLSEEYPPTGILYLLKANGENLCGSPHENILSLALCGRHPKQAIQMLSTAREAETAKPVGVLGQQHPENETSCIKKFLFFLIRSPSSCVLKAGVI